ncbi:hypothetical protein ES695_08545 [Candidatus Atribacteria bacterium 1244-E10-H5-B2]|nr:MAG: hypothetical protein ES695_08545 [Candidatus Atribacteria bacterium 1244-E10-H5-B2]
MAWLSDFNKRMKLTIDNTKINASTSQVKLWTEYGNNPILSPEGDEDITVWGSVLKVGSTYHMYYSYLDVGNARQIGHATSDDGKSWTKDAVNNPVFTKGVEGKFDDLGVWCSMVWKESTTWHMIYTGQETTSEIAVGYATSSDGIEWTRQNNGNAVLVGTAAAWDEADVEGWGIIKVNSTYYLWYNTVFPAERKVGLATSTNLTEWTKDGNNPLFDGHRMCSFPFKRGSYYYLLVSYFSGDAGDYPKGIELYRDTNPTFYTNDRTFLGEPILGVDGQWNRRLETPCILTDDIGRDSYAASNNELWCYMGGDTATNVWKTGMTIESDIDIALTPTTHLSWFPATVFLSSVHGDCVFDELVADANRFKIAFTKSDGITQLYGEIEKWDDSNESAIIHVSRDGWFISDTADTVFYMYYDIDASNNITYIGDIDSTPGGKVWNDRFRAVYHKVDATTSTIKDSTKNNEDGTKKAANEPIEAAGKIGQGQDFDGVDDYINITSEDVTPQTGTFELLFNTDDVSADRRMLSEIGGGGYFNFKLTGTDDKFQMKVHDRIDFASYEEAVSISTWYYAVAAFDTDDASFYMDGAWKSTDDTFVGLFTDGTGIKFGHNRSNTPGTAYDGKLDEARISDIVRNTAWIKGTYNSLWDTLLTYGSEEEELADFEYVGTGTFAYSGTAIIIIGFTCEGSGELTYSGTAIQSHTKSYFTTASGQLVYSGSADQVYSKNYLYEGSGSLTFSGEAVIIIGLAFVGGGSLTYSGEASVTYSPDYLCTAVGELIYSGEAIFSYLCNFLFTGSGELAYSGVAEQSYTYSFSYEADGSFTFSGEGTYTLGFAYTSSGELAYSGTAICEYTIVGADFEYAGSGSLIYSGEATQFHTKDFVCIASGTLTFSGAYTLEISYIGSGSFAFSGIGTYSIEFAYVGAGTLTYSGEAGQSHTKDFLCLASGSFIYSGLSSYTLGLIYTGTGTLIFGGIASQVYTKNFLYPASGQITYSGEAIQSHTKVFSCVASGVLSFSGAGTYSLGFTCVGSGAYNFGGTGLYSLGLSYVGSGNFVTSGSGSYYYLIVGWEYIGSGVFSYLGDAVYRYTTLWSKVTKEIGDWAKVDKEKDEWTKIDREKEDWGKTGKE